MQSCPNCLGLLRPDPESAAAVFADALAEGRRLPRPSDRAPFASGPSCTLVRLVAGGNMVLCGAEGFIEASVVSPGHRARPPLRCTSFGATLFVVETYAAADRALVAVDGDGAPLATYLPSGSLLETALEVRDDCSAPVARFEPGVSADGERYRVVETGGGVIATVSRSDIQLDRYLDDEWGLRVRTTRLPLAPLGLVGLVVAAKVLFGRTEPVETPPDDHRPLLDEWR